MYWPRLASPSSSGTETRRLEGSARVRVSDARTLRAMTGCTRRIWLAALVHGDAFRLDPLGYMQALIWRVRGLKVRSRNRLAALMGRSPRAYRLWIARVEPEVYAQLLGHGTSSALRVTPVVDCTGGHGLLETTLRSLAHSAGGEAPIIVGRDSVREGLTIADLSELATLVSATGTWLCIVKSGDRLAPAALQIYARAAVDAHEACLVYADDDLHLGSERHSPHFKSSWNPELFEHHDFVTGAAMVRATPEMLAGLHGPNWVQQLTHRAIARGAAPIHVPAVLHHRQERPEPTLPAKPVSALAEPAPAVTVIIPTRNRLSFLRPCIEGLRKTAYPNLDVIVIDNASDEPDTLDYLALLKRHGVRVLEIGGAFNFSALNNAAVKRAKGDLLCFLNNDVEIVDPDWLSLLVRQAARADIGAVGGRLLYPDGAIQHAGVVTGVGGGAAHAHRNLRDDDPGYFLRDRLPQRVSAVTAACLVVSKEKFLAVDGFDEVDFPVAFNDVDLCLKLNALGWQTFYEPRAVLIHHESKSRGSDSAKENRERFASELAALKRRWGTDQLRDPYHHPHLSPFCEQFHIAV